MFDQDTNSEVAVRLLAIASQVNVRLLDGSRMALTLADAAQRLSRKRKPMADFVQIQTLDGWTVWARIYQEIREDLIEANLGGAGNCMAIKVADGLYRQTPVFKREQ